MVTDRDEDGFEISETIFDSFDWIHSTTIISGNGIGIGIYIGTAVKAGVAFYSPFPPLSKLLGIFRI
jgi:hypothetical protein